MKNLIGLCLIVALMAGCSSKESKVSPVSSESAPPFKMSLAYSEYPSWSVFGVAEKRGLLSGKEGEQGDFEKLHNVDIVLKLVDYDTCLGLYGQGLVDAVCVTNVDVLAPSQRRKTVVVAPTSTSAGADALITIGADSLDQIKWTDLNEDGKIDASDRKVYGLEKSVSEFVFEQVLTKMGKSPKDYTFTNLDPAAAATALQSSQKNIQAIMVWNPFVLQTLRTNTNTKVVLSSETIPEYVIDCLAVGNDVLEKEGSERAVKVLLDSFYAINFKLAEPLAREQTLADLGEKFCSLDVADMAVCCEQTRFYSSKKLAIDLFESKAFREVSMPAALEFAAQKELIDSTVKFGFDGSPSVTVTFTTKYLK